MGFLHRGIGAGCSAIVLALILSAGSMPAAVSLQLVPGKTGSFSVPSRAPYNAIGSNRLEFRIHDWATPTAASRLLSFGGWIVELRPTGEVCVQNTRDSSPDYGGSMCADITGQTDVVVRVQRNTTLKVTQLEVASALADWRAVSYCGTKQSGTNINKFPCPIQTVNSGTWAGSGTLGGTNTLTYLAWMKWHSTLLPLESPMTNSYDPADLADWLFENSGSDQGGAINISINNVFYGASPVYLPVAKARVGNRESLLEPMTFRAGYPSQLDASGSFTFTDQPPSMYLWTTIDGPSELVFDDNTAINPTIQGLVFGSYLVELTVVDDRGQRQSQLFRFGAVATDDNGVVIWDTSNPDSLSAKLDVILGPQIRFGANPWPWADSRHKYLADSFGALLSTDYQAFWTNFEAGTLSVTNGSKILTGTGTNFSAVFGCPDNNGKGITIRYQKDGVWRYVAYGLDRSTCTETSISLQGPWLAMPGTLTDLSYSVWTNADLARWGNQSSNVNYYDNALAHYSLYFRSGNSTYLDYARNLADRWVSCPFINHFEEILWAVRINGAPRMRGFTGLMIRALDGKPEYFSVLRSLLNYDTLVIDSPAPIGDIREESIRLQNLSLGAMFDPDPNKRSQYLAKVNSAFDQTWAPQRSPQGTWLSNPALSSGAVVTKDSTTVTGTNFSTGTCSNFIWFAVTATDGDPVAYRCTYVSPTQITLNRPYEGSSGTKKYNAANLVGRGTQPFALGIVGTALRYAHLATGRPQMNEFILGLTDWLRDYGFRPSAKGLFYGRIFPNCEPSPETVRECADAGDGPGASRSFSGEVYASFSAAQMIAPNPQRRDLGDLLYGVNFGRPGYGGPATEDNLYDQGLNDNGFVVTQKKAKDYGFYFGFGFASQWPAARLGGAAPFLSQSVELTTSLMEKGAATDRITVTQANGAVQTENCTAENCTVTVDGRLGSVLVLHEYFNAEGAPMPDLKRREVIQLNR